VNQIFGQVYAPAYDLLYRDKDYDREVNLLQQLFGKYAARPVRSILDLGCGTGNHALRLAAQGHQVVGVDRSAEMLAVADRKLDKYHADLRLHKADIRDADLGQTFDAVLMMFSVLGYQIEDAEVLQALQTARRHLQPNGLLFFDIWYGPAVLAQGPVERVRTIEQANKTWMRTSSGRLEIQRNLCHVEFQLRRMSGDRILEETKESHTVRYFFAKEIDWFLDSSGFRRLRLGAFPEFDWDPDHTTWNAMVVAGAV
jgi:SAM-dependent methyltransferase